MIGSSYVERPQQLCRETAGCYKHLIVLEVCALNGVGDSVTVIHSRCWYVETLLVW